MECNQVELWLERPHLRVTLVCNIKILDEYKQLLVKLHEKSSSLHDVQQLLYCIN